MPGEGRRERGRPETIAIDGPAASGKSTVGRAVAAHLGYLFLDTGLLYRALGRLALDQGVPTDDGAALAKAAVVNDIDVLAAPGTAVGYVVTVAKTDVTALLASPEVDEAASRVSAHAEVRTALLPLQRRVGARGAVVMAGRDIGTVVLPDADLKLYLDASPEGRARRRLLERRGQGAEDDYRSVLAAVLARDARDAGRSIAPLAAASDAVVVDTDPCDADEVVAHVIALVERWPDALTTGGGRAPCRGRPAEGADGSA